MMPEVRDLATALYYTFSTVAQTLAGAVGLLAAFAVLRLSHLNQQLRDEAQHLRDGITDPGVRAQATTLLITHQSAALIALCRRNVDSMEPNVRDSRLHWAEDFQREKDNALRCLRRALQATGGAIMISVGAVSMTPWISRHPYVVIGCLIVGIATVGVCVTLYFRVLRALLRG